MICHICASPDYEDDKNLIVFCSICNISVHQKCYNILKIPEDDWICQPCSFFGEKGKMLKCPLCNCRGGAMVRVNILSSMWKDKNPFYYQNFEGKEETPLFNFQNHLLNNKDPQIYNAYKETYEFTQEELID